jgi:hypothetical protein
VTSEGANPLSQMCGNSESCRITYLNGVWSPGRYPQPRQRRSRRHRRAEPGHDNHDVLHLKVSCA